MTDAIGIGPGGPFPLRYKARTRRARAAFRALFWAALWASLAHASLAAFKLAQIRVQPDAVATGLPGFLFRLVIRPLEWLVEGAHGAVSAPLALQAAMVVTIFVISSKWLPIAVRTLGGVRS